eukprot:363694-Chlamydomonas_euryale.AAC.12
MAGEPQPIGALPARGRDGGVPSTHIPPLRHPGVACHTTALGNAFRHVLSTDLHELLASKSCLHPRTACSQELLASKSCLRPRAACIQRQLRALL